MNLKHLALLAVTALAISGCSTFRPEPKVVVQTKLITPNVPILSAPKPLSLNDVSWYVVTEENFPAFLEKYKKEHGDAWVFYAMSVRSYESMALNMAELKRYLQQQNAIIVYYEDALIMMKKSNDAPPTDATNNP
jgi:hypothetical protein